jgi:predicted nucleic acid-binding protein
LNRCLVDSNILLRLVHPDDPLYVLVRSAVLRLRRRGYIFYIVPQCLVEFWSVSTRPTTARGGYGLASADAHAKARLLERRFPLLEDRPLTHRIWRRLVVRHSVKGIAAHDARLVAAMRAHDVTQILTLNDSDFARYAGVTALNPAVV